MLTRCPHPCLIFAAIALLFGGVACSSGGTGNGGNPKSDSLIWGTDATSPPGVDVIVPSEKCKADDECPAETPFCSVSGYCFECTDDTHCEPGKCFEGYCVPSVCSQGEKRCAGNTALTCNATNDGWDKFVCVDSQCVNGECTGCQPGKKVCQSGAVMACNANGTGYALVMQCPAGTQCLNGDCISCFPGAKQCNGNVVETCNETSAWDVTEDCAAQGKTCALGTCVSACFSDLKSASNTGCDYWAIDLDNHSEAANGPFAVVIANLSDKVAEISVERKDSEAATTQVVLEQSVAAGDLQILALPPKEREAIHRKASSYASHTMRFAAPDAPRTEKVIVQAIRIGNQAIVSMPFEVLVEIGLEIKDKSPFSNTFLIELANGGYGYLPPPNQHELGGYETWLGTSRFLPNASTLLTRNLLEMLKELSQQKNK